MRNKPEACQSSHVGSATSTTSRGNFIRIGPQTDHEVAHGVTVLHDRPERPQRLSRLGKEEAHSTMPYVMVRYGHGKPMLEQRERVCVLASADGAVAEPSVKERREVLKRRVTALDVVAPLNSTTTADVGTSANSRRHARGTSGERVDPERDAVGNVGNGSAHVFDGVLCGRRYERQPSEHHVNL
jgi:hypothetical protein